MTPVTKPRLKPMAMSEVPIRAQSTSSGWRVQSVDRAVHLLQAVAASGSAGTGTVALGDTCGLNRATAWRLLSTLEGHGFVQRDRSTNHWTIGSGMAEIVRFSGINEVLRDAHTVLENLAVQVGETAALAVLRQGDLICVDEVAPTSIVAVNWSGRTMSLHATSTGKVLLAWSTDDLSVLLPRRLERFTESTITDRSTLHKELDLAREIGYATCQGEFEPSAWGVSAPVLDPAGRLLAVISIWAPRDRVPAERLPALGEATKAAACRLAPS